MNRDARSSTGGATLADVAKVAGVSNATVSNVLNGLGKASKETEARVLQAVEALRYVPKRQGRPRRRECRQVAMIVEQISHEDPHRDSFLGEIISAAERTLRHHGYQLLFLVVPPTVSAEIRLDDAILRRRVDGVIILGGGDLSDTYIERVFETGLPLVLADNYLYDLPLNSITFDNLTGAYLAVTHLVQMGHRRIGFIQGPSKYKPLLERFLGYVQAMRVHGLAFDSRLIPPRSSGDRKGFMELNALLDLDDPPTAVFVVSDKAATHAMQAARERNVRIPQDLAVMGFDDIAEASRQVPKLSTVWTPKRDMGRVAAERLLQLIDYPEQPPTRIVLPTRTVVRQSTACGRSI